MNWKPIETAPKDGTIVLLGWDDDCHIPSVGCFNVNKGLWYCDRQWRWEDGHMKECPPTHWMPLPEPPK